MILPHHHLVNVFVVICLAFSLLDFVPAVASAAVNIDAFCPRIVHQVFEDYVPIGIKNAGNYTEAPQATRLWPCVESCCAQKDNCNVAFIYADMCYHVQCVSNELCLPVKHVTNRTTKLRMVLVNPVDDEASWLDTLKQANFADLTATVASAEHLEIPSQNARNYFDKYDGIPMSVNEDDVLYAAKSVEADMKDIYSGFNRFNPGVGAAAPAADSLYIDSVDNDLQMDESKFFDRNVLPCDAGLDLQCPAYQRCVQVSAESRRGVCECVETYKRNNRGECVKLSISDSPVAGPSASVEHSNDSGGASDAGGAMPIVPMKAHVFSATPPSTSTATPSVAVVKKLTVSVVSKEVRLPEQEVTLSAYTISDDISTSSTSSYKYLWSLISQPSGDVNGTMSDQTKDTIKLTNLSAGLYRFKVVVTAQNNVTGETYANVTVSPQKRINQAPQVVITPVNTTVKLPTSKAILDGSSSTDDDKIVLWHWDLIEGPIGYQSKLPETSTLQLFDLTAPGIYSFRLTVTDSDGARNSSTARVTVLKANDYPPEANAGADVIVYMPHNNVTLNGSLSTDDREIVSWEWTKDARAVSKAVDMQNTRTPYLQLSNLEVGLYTFVLKVTDISNQSSSASVNVFVKEPTNLPPSASAGSNMTVVLPRTWAILNATQSKDELKINRYEWTQRSGPNAAVLRAANASVANATALTVGTYEFQVNVFDENNNNATDVVGVSVVQEKNTPPKANAGGDQTVTLPVSTIYLNGTQSTDDLGVTNYTWTRDGASLAIGTIIGDSNTKPVLVLNNIVPGRYVFRLTVADAQGLTDSDTASVIVHPDPLLPHLVELTFSVDVSVLTQAEVETLQQRLLLILGDATRLRVRRLTMDPKAGQAILVFYVEQITNGVATTMAGLTVERLLFDRFWKDHNILGTPVTDVRTSKCQNQCSGHGTCQMATRVCICDVFWMPDIFWFWGMSQANCNWSILYFVIGIFVVFLCISSCCWLIMRACKRNKVPLRQRIKPQKYSPLGTHDDENPSQKRGTTTLSDSDTDSDILFESRTKTNGILRNSSGGAGASRSGKTTRLGRRIKT